jgi:hypothetical protein
MLMVAASARAAGGDADTGKAARWKILAAG